jgi:hypothetical protein
MKDYQDFLIILHYQHKCKVYLLCLELDFDRLMGNLGGR